VFTVSAGSADAAVNRVLTTLRDALPLDGVETITTRARRRAAVGHIAYAYRDGVCAHLRIEGACRPRPARPWSAVRWPPRSAGGSAKPCRGPRPPGASVLRMVGVYQPLDDADPYWGTGC